MTDSNLKTRPSVLAQHWTVHSRLFHVEELHLRFSNGAERIFERLNPGTHRAVMIVAMPDPETVLLVREFGAGIGDYYLSFPKGAIHPDEDLFETANRELKEEAGFGAKQFTFIKELFLSPSYMGNHISIVLATDLYEEKLPGDEPEPLVVETHSLNDLGALIAKADFKEAYAVAALYLVRDYLESLGE